MKKICSTCHKTKKVSKFYRNKSKKDGLTSQCKRCVLKSKISYHRSKKGLIGDIYRSQRARSIKRGHLPPTYSFEELKDYIENHKDFMLLYEKWVESGYDKWQAPSIDRLENSKGYSIDNIQLVSWKKNFYLSDKAPRTIRKLSKEGLVLGEYITLKVAAESVGANYNVGVVNVCNGKQKTAHGYKWEYVLKKQSAHHALIK